MKEQEEYRLKERGSLEESRKLSLVKEVPKKKDNRKRALFDLLKNKLEKEINEHENDVNSLCLLRDGRLASCSHDKTIKVFSLQTFECELNILAHSKSVTSISILDNGYLVSSSEDKTIKIWEINQKNFRLVQTITSHTFWVYKVIQLTGSRMASCSQDETIKIFNSEIPYNHIVSLNGHTNDIYSLIELKNRKYIVSGSEDKTIRFWNNKTYKCDFLVRNVYCCFRNSMIEIDKSRILVGGNNEYFIINALTFQLECQIEFDNEESNSIGYVNAFIEIDGGSLLFGCENGLIHVDVLEGKIIQLKKDAHKEDIRDLVMLSDGKFASCSDDETIKIWSI